MIIRSFLLRLLLCCFRRFRVRHQRPVDSDQLASSNFCILFFVHCFIFSDIRPHLRHHRCHRLSLFHPHLLHLHNSIRFLISFASLRHSSLPHRPRLVHPLSCLCVETPPPRARCARPRPAASTTVLPVQPPRTPQGQTNKTQIQEHKRAGARSSSSTVVPWLLPPTHALSSCPLSDASCAAARASRARDVEHEKHFSCVWPFVHLRNGCVCHLAGRLSARARTA